MSTRFVPPVPFKVSICNPAALERPISVNVRALDVHTNSTDWSIKRILRAFRKMANVPPAETAHAISNYIHQTPRPSPDRIVVDLEVDGTSATLKAVVMVYNEARGHAMVVA